MRKVSPVGHFEFVNLLQIIADVLVQGAIVHPVRVHIALALIRMLPNVVVPVGSLAPGTKDFDRFQELFDFAMDASWVLFTLAALVRALPLHELVDTPFAEETRAVVALQSGGCVIVVLWSHEVVAQQAHKHVERTLHLGSSQLFVSFGL